MQWFSAPWRRLRVGTERYPGAKMEHPGAAAGAVATDEREHNLAHASDAAERWLAAQETRCDCTGHLSPDAVVHMLWLVILEVALQKLGIVRRCIPPETMANLERQAEFSWTTFAGTMRVELRGLATTICTGGNVQVDVTPAEVAAAVRRDPYSPLAHVAAFHLDKVPLRAAWFAVAMFGGILRTYRMCAHAHPHGRFMACLLFLDLVATALSMATLAAVSLVVCFSAIVRCQPRNLLFAPQDLLILWVALTVAGAVRLAANALHWHVALHLCELDAAACALRGGGPPPGTGRAPEPTHGRAEAAERRAPRHSSSGHCASGIDWARGWHALAHAAGTFAALAGAPLCGLQQLPLGGLHTGDATLKATLPPAPRPSPRMRALAGAADQFALGAFVAFAAFVAVSFLFVFAVPVVLGRFGRADATGVAAAAAAQFASSGLPWVAEALSRHGGKALCVVCAKAPSCVGFIHAGTMHRAVCTDCCGDFSIGDCCPQPGCSKRVEKILRVYEA
ncbi:MAG: hypothetical protein J3K34DRAFT_489071 [Monoraphidium minutum]|nr:MAG: hypothetical protein J3K34DRAFT_489071 [Monoraphidium minutum]